MRAEAAKNRRARAQSTLPARRFRPVHYLAALALACVAALEVYWPALRGPFLFDDWTLPFNSPALASHPWEWLTGVRPALMFTYWLNYSLSDGSTVSYHVLNVLLHAANAVLVFFILWRLLERAPAKPLRRRWIAGSGAALFLLHPLETESVAYIAGRSEVLSAFFFLAALALFIDRAGRISWRAALAILALFAAGAAAKEHIVAALPAALLLTEWYFHGDRMGAAIRRNWRVYLPMLLAGVAGAVYVWTIIAAAPSAGLNLRDVTPLQYLYTSSRALFLYARLFLFPAGQNFDRDFPISHTPADYGAGIALAGVALLLAAALWLRRRDRLASYGLLLALALLAPTSSVIPLADAFAERRMYLPSVGLVIVLAAVLARWRVAWRPLAAVVGVVLLTAGVLTYRRCRIWSDAIVFWQDVVAKSPLKPRPYDHLIYSYVQANRERELVAQLEHAGTRLPRDYSLFLNWAHVYDRIDQSEKALAKLRQAAALNPSADVFALKGQILTKLGRREEALTAFDAAIAKEPPTSDAAHVRRAEWYEAAQRLDAAVSEYRQALTLNPDNADARNALAVLLARRRAQRP